MDERRALESAVHWFNDHPLDWRGVFDYVWIRWRLPLEERLDPAEVREIVEQNAGSFTDQICTFIDLGVDMLEELRSTGRIGRGSV